MPTSKEYREAHREQIKAYQKQYYETHKAERTAYKKAYYEANKERCKERTRRWEKENPDKVRENQRKYYHRKKARQGWMQKVKIKLDDGSFMPTRAHPTDAGLDLYCREDIRVWPGSPAVIDTGVHVELPPGYYGKIESKSGLNVKYDIVSCGGVIDEGYRGSIVVKLYNFGQRIYDFKAGDKIAQLIIQPYAAPELEVVNELTETDRGSNGFGSSGR